MKKLDETTGIEGVGSTDGLGDHLYEKHRIEVLAETIRALRDVVTHDAESKADFIERVRAILSADPDFRLTANDQGNSAAESRPTEPKAQ